MTDANAILALANEIRRVDGDHNKGAAELAEALWPYICKLAPMLDQSEDEAIILSSAQTPDALKLSDHMLARPLVRNASTEPCDALDGACPCSCGAWHQPGVKRDTVAGEEVGDA